MVEEWGLAHIAYHSDRLLNSHGRVRLRTPGKPKMTTDSKHQLPIAENDRRLHSTLCYKTPMDYEKDLNKVSGIS